MPDPSDEPEPFGDFVPRSFDHARQHPPPADGCYDAPEGNAYAQGGYAPPNQAFSQDPALIYPVHNPQLPHQAARGQFASYHSFDPYAPTHAAWDWTQSAGFTHFANHYEPQGELIHESQERRDATNQFSIPLPVNPLSPPPRPAVSPAMKRKSNATLQSTAPQYSNEHRSAPKRRAVSRASSTASQDSPAPTVLADAQPSPVMAAIVAQASASQPSTEGSIEGQRRTGTGTGSGSGAGSLEMDVTKPRRVLESANSSSMLPAGRVFPIQIGSVLFRLSGASLCSDAPSYFSHFFTEQLLNSGGRANEVRTLYIDRDPDTFRDIALHLQGYHIVPRDGEHFVKLFADAQFYSLPRLTKQLFKSDIFISIGGTPFRIPRSLFSAPGDSPNYFSLGFAQWFSVPSDVFPGLDRAALLRPPSINPPAVPNRSGETFAELMRMLQGYDVEIRSAVHRGQLLRDARYFHLKGLEQRLVPCEVSTNIKRGGTEILIRLEDIRQSGVGFAPDASTPMPTTAPTTSTTTSTSTSSSSTTVSTTPVHPPGFATYARPYLDDANTPHILILETSSPESLTLHFPAPSPDTTPDITATATFHASTHRRITSLLSILAAKTGLAPPSASTPLRVRIGESCYVELDGEVMGEHALGGVAEAKSHEEKDMDKGNNQGRGGAEVGRSGKEWVVSMAQWRVRVFVPPLIAAAAERGDGLGIGMDMGIGRGKGKGKGKVHQDGKSEVRIGVELQGVRIEAFTHEKRRNAARPFLGSA